MTAGSWTTYGDLAEFVGLSAQSVGGFMAESGAPGAHRVLQANGKISPGFRWPDPERTDDPKVVLQQEGLKFDDAGRADRVKRITANEFRKMFPYERVPTPFSDAQEDSNGHLAPFDQFQRNINYARQLIQGGQNLEHPIDYDSAPAEAGTLGPAPAPIGERRDDAPHAKREWDEESLLEAINRYCPGKVANALLAVYRHAERHGAFRGYHYGEGEYPSVTARFSVGTDEAAAWSVYIGVTKSVLSINFAELRDHGVPPQTLSQLAGSLSRLPGWTDVPQQLKKGNYAARVSIESAALAEHNTANVVIEGLNTLLASASGRS